MANLPTYRDAIAHGTLFIEDVDRIDCAVFDPSKGVVGQSWHVDVQVAGNLDKNGFVYDFSHLKKLVRQVLKATIDHALLIPVMSKQVNFTETPDGELWQLRAKARLTNLNSEWEYKCPKGAVFPVRAVNVTRDLVEQEASRLIRHRLPETIHSLTVKLREESSEPTAAFFRYTHGITNHDGLCQRLFHGHRSRIEIFLDNERRPDLEHYIAHQVFGSIVHVAGLSQIIAGHGEVGIRPDSTESVRLAYEGSRGRYEASLPANRVFFVEPETSIETMAQQLARLISQKEQGTASVRVACFEGIGKGAIGEA